MVSKELFKEFKHSVNAFFKNNSGEKISVCIQAIDKNLTSFLKLPCFEVSWGEDELFLFIPNTATFQIPYTEIRSFSQHSGGNIEIALEGGMLFSIRKA